MADENLKPSALDRVLMTIAPKYALDRMRARAAALAMARHYDAASTGRRTSGWQRNFSDVNAANVPAIQMLRAHARDMVRNNSWARNGLRTIAKNTVGWGIHPKAMDLPEASAAALHELWRKWAGSTECDADGRKTFYGMQAHVIRAVAESGEVLIRRRRRRVEDGLTIPLQLQVLESDYLDTRKDGLRGQQGGPIIQGVEYDGIGRRAAYWLFEQHPGAMRLWPSQVVSKRVPAEDVLHIYAEDRPGQVRGITWFAPVIVNLKDFDEYEDATLMRQKIAACFAAFVTDTDGGAGALGAPDEQGDPTIETIEPGTISYLPMGKSVEFSNPPVVSDHDSFSKSNLRRVAAGLGVTYEDLTGDYSQVNFSSARMARLSHWANVHDWRWNMLIPHFCDPVWRWAMEQMIIAGEIDCPAPPDAQWTPPPMPMIEPDKEGLAYVRLVRAGAMTHDEMVREQGQDPDQHWAEYAAGLKKLDAFGIKLDSDVRAVSQAGLTQERVGAGGGGGKAPAKSDEGDAEKE
jgi:lambda family phage portal protein